MEVLRAARLRQDEVLHGQVQETCAVRLHLLVALDQFVQLQAHHPRHGGGGGGDGGDDPPSDALTLQKPEVVFSTNSCPAGSLKHIKPISVFKTFMEEYSNTDTSFFFLVFYPLYFKNEYKFDFR